MIKIKVKDWRAESPQIISRLTHENKPKKLLADNPIYILLTNLDALSKNRTFAGKQKEINIKRIARSYGNSRAAKLFFILAAKINSNEPDSSLRSCVNTASRAGFLIRNIVIVAQ